MCNKRMIKILKFYSHPIRKFEVIKLQSSHYVKSPLEGHKQVPLYTEFS